MGNIPKGYSLCVTIHLSHLAPPPYPLTYIMFCASMITCQVHLLSAHIDDLTTETSAPLDRLMALSLQANETTGQAHQYLMSKFENKSTLLLEQLEEVWILFEEIMKKTVLGQPTEVAISSSRAAIMFLRNLSPHAVEAARNLASE